MGISPIVNLITPLYFCFRSWLTRISNLKLSNVLEYRPERVSNILWNPRKVQCQSTFFPFEHPYETRDINRSFLTLWKTKYCLICPLMMPLNPPRWKQQARCLLIDPNPWLNLILLLLFNPTEYILPAYVIFPSKEIESKAGFFLHKFHHTILTQPN